MICLLRRRERDEGVCPLARCCLPVTVSARARWPICRLAASQEHHCEVLRELLVGGRAMIREPFDIIGGPVTVACAMRVRVLSQGIGQPLAETPRPHGFLRLLTTDA